MNKVVISCGVVAIFTLIFLLSAISQSMLFDKNYLTSDDTNLLVAAVTAFTSIGSIGTLLWLIYERYLDRERRRLEEALSHKKWFYSLLHDIEHAVSERFKFNRYKMYKYVYFDFSENAYKYDQNRLDEETKISFDWYCNKYKDLYHLTKETNLDNFGKLFFYKACDLINELSLDYKPVRNAGDVYNHDERHFFNIFSIHDFCTDMRIVLGEISLHIGKSKLEKIELNRMQIECLIEYALKVHSIKNPYVYCGSELWHWWSALKNLKSIIGSDATLNSFFATQKDVYEMLGNQAERKQLELYGVLERYKNSMSDDEYKRLFSEISNLSDYFLTPNVTI